MFSLLQNWPVQNCITALLVAVMTLLAWRLSHREYWRLAARELCGSRRTLVCGAILCLYAGIAILDSIGWRNPVMDTESGLPRRDSQGKIVLDKGASVLDRILKLLTSHREKTYSAPLATRLHTTSTQPDAQGRPQQIHPPLNYPRTHLLGTDLIGQDVLVQCLKSIRTGLIIGLLNTLLAIPFALLFGLCAGYYGGIIDDGVQYLCTLLASIPSVLLVAAIMVIAGRGLPQLCLAMGLASWTGLCRLLRGEALRLRESDFVTAATALGVPSWQIILRHLLPNVLHLVLIQVVLRFSGEVLAEAALTYLGIGVGADTMSWGTMLNDARSELTRTPIVWWKLCSAFGFMLALVLPANLFGDAVRDALDPRLRTQ